MRILHVSYDHVNNPWVGGGIALRTHEVCRRLQDRHDIVVATSGWPSSADQETIDGVHYLHLGHARKFRSSVVAFRTRIPRVISETRPDLLVADLTTTSPFHPALFAGVPCVAILHHANSLSVLHRHGAIAYRLVRLVERALVSRQRYIISVSSDTEQQVHDLATGAYLATVIPNGVDETLGLGPSTEEHFFLVVGRLDIMHKGLDMLVVSFREVLRTKPDVRLVIAGRGRDESRLRRMISKAGVESRVALLGYVSDDEKGQLLRSCLAVCMPSRFEGWGIAAIEAAACGKAVIGYDVVGVREAVRHGETGLLVPLGDTSAFANAMTLVAEDSDLRHRLGIAAREWACQFSWDRTALAQEAFYYEVLRDARAKTGITPGDSNLMGVGGRDE